MSDSPLKTLGEGGIFPRQKELVTVSDRKSIIDDVKNKFHAQVRFRPNGDSSLPFLPAEAIVAASNMNGPK
jgi:hypothetical protein